MGVLTGPDLGVIDSVSKLEWLSKLLAKGLLLGKHRAKKLGTGMEFDQYRAYTQGDDIRLIDWKMYAKSGKYFVRQSMVETNNRLHIIFDNSKSMDYKEDDYSKFQLSKLIASTLSYVMSQQSDEFSWQSGDISFPKSQGIKKWRKSLLDLYQLSTTEQQVESYQPTDGIVLWLTDLYMEIDDIKSVVDALNERDSELVVMHILGQKEEELNFSKTTKFVDLESDNFIEVTPKSIVDDYKVALGEHIMKAKKIFSEKSVIYRKVYLQSDIRNELRSFITDYNYMQG